MMELLLGWMELVSLYKTKVMDKEFRKQLGMGCLPVVALFVLIVLIL